MNVAIHLLPLYAFMVWTGTSCFYGKFNVLELVLISRFYYIHHFVTVRLIRIFNVPKHDGSAASFMLRPSLSV